MLLCKTFALDLLFKKGCNITIRRKLKPKYMQNILIQGKSSNNMTAFFKNLIILPPFRLMVSNVTMSAYGAHLPKSNPFTRNLNLCAYTYFLQIFLQCMHKVMMYHKADAVTQISVTRCVKHT